MNHAPLEFTSDIVVRQIGGYGTDADIVAAARVDPDVPENALTLKDSELLRFLMKEHHGTPFEHAAMKFYVEAPIFVGREHFRHRAGHSFNEFSTRYKRMGSKANPMRVYLPPLEEYRTQVGTPGNYTFAQATPDIAARASQRAQSNALLAYGSYTADLDDGIAKEQARNHLPLETMTKYIWSTNPRSLMHFLSLRSDPQALLEIQHVASKAEALFAKQFPETHDNFQRYGRRAP